MTTAERNTEITKQTIASLVLNLRKEARKESCMIGNEPIWQYTEIVESKHGVQIEITVYSNSTVYMIDENGVSLFFWNIETAAEFITEIV